MNAMRFFAASFLLGAFHAHAQLVLKGGIEQQAEIHSAPLESGTDYEHYQPQYVSTAIGGDGLLISPYAPCHCWHSSGQMGPEIGSAPCFAYVPPGYPPDLLRAGDQLIEVRGEKFSDKVAKGNAAIKQALDSASNSKTPIRIVIRRNGQLVTLPPVTWRRSNWSSLPPQAFQSQVKGKPDRPRCQ